MSFCCKLKEVGGKICRIKIFWNECVIDMKINSLAGFQNVNSARAFILEKTGRWKGKPKGGNENYLKVTREQKSYFG